MEEPAFQNFYDEGHFLWQILQVQYVCLVLFVIFSVLAIIFLMGYAKAMRKAL